MTEYVSLEPNRELEPALRRVVGSMQPCEFPFRLHAAGLEAVKGEQFDRIILGNVLCEVDDPVSFLRTVDSLLKPGGRVYFSEHVLEDSGWRRTLQHLVAPWWALVSDGCHCEWHASPIPASIPPTSPLVFATLATRWPRRRYDTKHRASPSQATARHFGPSKRRARIGTSSTTLSEVHRPFR